MTEREREKVIKGLECCTNPTMEPCLHSCPYQELYDPKNGFKNCMSALLPDAIALLKKQEPILLENQHKPYGISTNANSPWISRCPRCGKKVEGKQTRFCKYCGQAVKWE